MATNTKLRVVFLGCTKYSEQLLQAVYQTPNVIIEAIFSTPKSFNISYSEKPVENVNYADLSTYANQWGIPFYEVDSVDGKRLTDHTTIIKNIQPDVILVLGWYYMVPKSVRNIAKFGAWGIHASLLPDYAGGAPLVWAIINGEEVTGVTLFRLDDGVDDGDIISQESFIIEEHDTIQEVYEKATNTSIFLINNVLQNIDNVSFRAQDKAKIKVYPQRKPEDGEIDLSWPAKRIYNFVRAQSSPYPGAFIKTTDGKKIIIEKARIDEY